MGPEHAMRVLNIAAAGLLAWQLLAPAYHHRATYADDFGGLALESSRPHLRPPHGTLDALPDAATYLACAAAPDALTIELQCVSNDEPDARR